MYKRQVSEYLREDLLVGGVAECVGGGTNPAVRNTTDKKILSQVLNNYDQEPTDFYRWKVEYRCV